MDELAGLSEDARKRAMERFRMLQPHLEQNEPLAAVAKAAGLAYRTAHRLVSQYRRDGLVALVRKKRTDRGQRRAVSDKLKAAIEGLALQKPPLPVSALHRRVIKLAQEIGEPPPSYGTVFNIVRGLPSDLVTLAHDGPKAYADAFELVHRREAQSPNAIWQADHTPLDILLLRPDGTVAKPWLTAVIDDHSRAVAGYFLSFDEPSALHTSLALWQAIWRKEDPRWIICGIGEPTMGIHDGGADWCRACAACVLREGVEGAELAALADGV